jgi:hypothetical protein
MKDKIKAAGLFSVLTIAIIAMLGLACFGAYVKLKAYYVIATQGL